MTPPGSSRAWARSSSNRVQRHRKRSSNRVPRHGVELESSYHLSFGGLPTECSTAGLPAGLSSTCIEIQKVSFSHLIKLVQSTMVPLKFRTKDCAHAAQTFSHLAHGARILRRRVIILVSAGFQPNSTQQDYPLDQHALKSLKVEMNKENHLFYGIES